MLLFLAVYMDGNDCDSRKLVGGATVFSHTGTTYSHNIDCRITFKAEREGWKLLIRLVHLDIPDTSYNQLCNDALYVYDAKNIFGQPMVSRLVLWDRQHMYGCSS